MATPDMLDSISSAQQTFKTSDEQYLQERARCWITKLLGQELPDAVMALLLQNGRVLALVAEALEAACDGRGRMQQALSRSDLGPRRYHRQLDDINSFLQVCVRLGIAKDDLPALTDISRGTNVVATCRTLFALANKGTKLKVAGIPAFASVEEAAAARKSAMSRAHSSEKAKQFDQHSPHGDAHPAQRLSLERRCSGPSSRENDQSLSNQADGVPSVFQQSLRCRVASPAASPGLAFGPHSGKESEEGFSPCSTLDMYELQRHGSDTSSSSRSSASDEEPRTTGMQQGELPAEAKRKKQSQRSHRAWGRALLAAAAGLGAAVVGALVVGRHSRRRPAHYLVVEGDTLLQVLEQLAGGRATGEDALQRLLAKNPHLADNPDLIFPAQRIRL
ncbi:hypothetical protein WJX72_003934 [[Myrmecia] bisecta]|uniref:LysM domain-containing protein n=1 Tax=[Myrmecia] bisecta TaxID=41462 RepID=A0AAW1P4F4_9CHLO